MNLDELRKQAREALELADKAIEGPWTANFPDGSNGYWHVNTNVLGHSEAASCYDENSEMDAAFIAASRTLVPDLANKLLEALDELEGRIADAKTHAEAMKLSAQEKLELKTNLDFAHSEWAKDLQDRNDLRAELERVTAVVTWKQLDYEDGDTWECSGCGHMTVWEESPEDNEVHFCSYCGHPVKFERYVEPREDNEE